MEKEEKKTFAVVIPTWNRLGLLRDTIASVRAQTVPVDEILVVDDGSTDGSIEWLRGQSDIHLLEGQGGGPGGARNRGVCAAASDYICFLDSDDVWHPQLIGTVRTLLEEEGAALVIAGHEIFEAEPPDFPPFDPGRIRYRKFPTVLSCLLDGKAFLGSGAWAAVDKKLFDEGKLFIEGRGINMEDIEWLFQNGGEGPVVWINEPNMVGYRIHGNQVTKTPDFYLRGAELFLSKEEQDLYPSAHRADRRRMIARQTTRLMKGIASRRDMASMIALIRRQWQVLGMRPCLPLLPRQLFYLSRGLLRACGLARL